MNFEDEPYVRLYKRKTITFKRIGWEGRLVLWHLMLEVDRAGIVDVGEGDEAGAVAVLLDLPEDIVRTGLSRLASHGVTRRHGTTLVISRFIEAQEATRSDASRAREYRERRRDAASRGVTSESRNVTAPSRTVTDGHEPSLSTLQYITDPQTGATGGGDRLDLDYATECPPALAEMLAERGLIASMAKQHGVSAADVAAAVRDYAEHFTRGRGFGEKRKNWVRCARGKVLDLHKQGRLAGMGGDAPEKNDETGGYGKVSDWK